jgi:LacI family transcriptional regulator
MRSRRLPAARSVVKCAAFTEPAGAQAASTLLDQGHEFTALVAGNDLLALGAQAAMEERGLTCPDDFSITGYNDLNFVARLKPALTTVRLPLDTIGELAARALLDWIRNPTDHVAVQTLLPVEFVERGTTSRNGLRRPTSSPQTNGPRRDTRRVTTSLRGT